MSAIGVGGSSATLNQGRMFMRLKRQAQIGCDQIIQELRPKLAQIPGINFFMNFPPLIRIGGHMTKSSTNTACRTRT